jgi:hypothetical protein
LRTKKICALAVIVLLSVMLSLSFFNIPTAKATNSIEFFGPRDEQTNLNFYLQNGSAAICNVIINYVGGHELFDLTAASSYVFSYTTEELINFDFTVIDNSTGTPVYFHREYFWTPSDVGMTSFYVFFGHRQLPYVINFIDYTGTLKDAPYIRAEAAVGSSTYPPGLVIEKRPIDGSNTVVMELQQGSRYELYYGNGTDWTDYGAFYATGVTGVQLVIRGVAFPQNILALYQYVHAYSVRDYLNPVGSITISYGDTTSLTTSVTITITDTDTDTIAFQQTFSGPSYQTFSYTWPYATNATNYQVTEDIVHSQFGNFNFKQYLLGEYTKASAPFSLDFLGTIGVSTAWFIPAMLIIFVAGCFSELTSEAAAIITTIVAILLAVMGWISISSSALVVALSLSIMAGIVSARRRFT